MKYRSSDNTFKDIYVKTSDTLPIGSIVDYDGTTVPVGYEEVEDKGEIYSTEETRVGTWLDDKPLYRKVVSFTTTETIGDTSLTTNITINHNVSNLNRITKVHICDSLDGIYPIANGGATANVNYYTSTALNFRLVNITLTARTFYIVIDYTKTTD